MGTLLLIARLSASLAGQWVGPLEMTIYAPERCQARVEATAQLTAANIYRIDAKRMIPDRRARKACGPWPTDLVWLLQRR